MSLDGARGAGTLNRSSNDDHRTAASLHDAWHALHHEINNVEMERLSGRVQRKVSVPQLEKFEMVLIAGED